MESSNIFEGIPDALEGVGGDDAAEAPSIALPDDSATHIDMHVFADLCRDPFLANFEAAGHGDVLGDEAGL